MMYSCSLAQHSHSQCFGVAPPSPVAYVRQPPGTLPGITNSITAICVAAGKVGQQLKLVFLDVRKDHYM